MAQKVKAARSIFDKAAQSPRNLNIGDIGQLDQTIDQFVPQALERHNKLRQSIRGKILPRTGLLSNASKDARWMLPKDSQVESGLHYLLDGQVAGCDGSIAHVGTPTLQALQITTATVDHKGLEEISVERISIDPIHQLGLDPETQVLEILAAMSDQQTATGAQQSQLAGRGLMALEERRRMLEILEGRWGIGHGNLVDFTMLAMASDPQTIYEGLDVLKGIVDAGHFVYVASQPANPSLSILADALDPSEYAILSTLDKTLLPVVHSGHYRGAWEQTKPKIIDFVENYASQVSVGIYRASHEASGKVFYAHRMYADPAAILAIADSQLQPTRGFPMLIDKADFSAGRSTVSQSTFANQFNAAMIASGGFLVHQSERDSRYARAA